MMITLFGYFARGIFFSSAKHSRATSNSITIHSKRFSLNLKTSYLNRVFVQKRKKEKTLTRKASNLNYYESGGFSLQDIKVCGKGDLASLLNVVVWCIDRPEKHFAKVLTLTSFVPY